MKFSTTFTLAALMLMSSGTDARIGGNQRELHSHHHSHGHDHGHTPSTDHNKSSGYEVYGVNTCGFGVKKWHKKTDVDVSFYLADDDIVQATVKEGGCHYFGHTTKEQPEYSTKGEGIDFQPTKWPDTFTCKGLKGTGKMIQDLDNLCTDVEFPENACVVVVC